MYAVGIRDLFVDYLCFPPVVEGIFWNGFCQNQAENWSNKMSNSLLDDCLVTFIERCILDDVDEDDVIKTSMAIIKRHRPKSSVIILFGI
jgi:hypothetical protein